MWRWWGAGTSCPVKLRLPPPWQGSRSGWTGLWATWSTGNCPCPWQGGWNLMIYKVPSNPNHSMILRFSAAAILLQNHWSSVSAGGGGSLWSGCHWRDFAILRQCESHWRAVVPCIFCTSTAIHLLPQLLGKLTDNEEGREMSPSMLYLFLPVLGLEGTCQNNFPVSACKRMSTGI